MYDGSMLTLNVAVALRAGIRVENKGVRTKEHEQSPRPASQTLAERPELRSARSACCADQNLYRCIESLNLAHT